MKIITSESVFSGHPDKICDQISDAILDAVLEQDKNSRVGIECAIKDNLVLLFGEITTSAVVDYKKVASKVLKDIGYEEDFCILEKISLQSADIAIGVNKTNIQNQGAGDQGMMYGYACNETPEFMPLTLVLAHDIAMRVDELRKTKYPHLFGPDGKCQVSVRYNGNTPIAIDTIIISAQTKPGIVKNDAIEVIYAEVITYLIGWDLMDIRILTNPTGAFEIGGPYADSGLTGRKIIVDTYGGCAKHGGGAFSGKDVSKVDRSASYYARYVARTIVEAELAERCEVCISYSIGIAEPVSISVDTFGTSELTENEFLELVKKHFDFKPSSIRKELKLDSVKFQPLACYGHMGREDLNVPWENTYDKAVALRLDYEKTKRNT